MQEENATYVEQDGLAVVHRGERIVAAPGSEAVLSASGSGGDVHYYFPVHVVVVGGVSEEVRSEIESRVMTSLYSALS
jgi:hypothetical protein